MITRICFGIFLAFSLPALCAAATHVVDQGGGGDFTTINDALAVAGTGDRIEVNPGTYAESCTLSVSLEFVGVAGAESTILDGGGTTIIMWINGGTGTVVEGLSFVNGYHDSGSGIHMSHAATAIVRNCVFEDNIATWNAGGLYTCMYNTHVDVSECVFRNNYAVASGGAMLVNTHSSATVSNCEFLDNWSDDLAGCIHSASSCDLSVSESLFLGNSGDEAGALLIDGGSGLVSGCTFHDNPARLASVMISTTETHFTHNIVTNNSSPTPCVTSSLGTHDYNIFGPVENVLPGVLNAHEWAADPLYCDHLAGDLHVCASSPALPENNGFALIGLYGKGCTDCGPVETQATSWGELKTTYR